MRIILCLLLFLIAFRVNQHLMAESDAEILGSARVLQDHIDSDKKRTERDAFNIYDERTRNPADGISLEQIGDKLAIIFIGGMLFCFLAIWLFDIFNPQQPIVTKSPNRSMVSEAYLDALRKPLKLEKQKPQKTTGTSESNQMNELLKEFHYAAADRKWEIYNIFKKNGWGKPY